MAGAHPQPGPARERARLTEMLDQRSGLGMCAGTGLIILGVATGHTLIDGNCDENRLGPVPNNGHACARIGGIWTSSTGAMHITYLVTQILSWALITAGVAIVLAGFAASLSHAQLKAGKQSRIDRTISRATEAASHLRNEPLIPRAVAMGATTGLVVGGIAGLIRRH